MARLAIVLVMLLGFASSAAAQQTRSARDISWDQLQTGEADCPKSRSVENVQLDYPAASLRAREEGRVVVGLCIDVDGYPETVEILSDPGIPRLKIATAQWACGRRFEPDIGGDGRAVRSCARVVEFTWRLTDFPRWTEFLNRPPPQDVRIPVRAAVGG